ncbi:FtsX-like permease family protein [Kribbella sp. NPDC050820]|uniref:ABC transporter permease n=1 Tax=Kribbella sp. NPDC050820 TaxID=3155408 RepID=UPI0033DFC16C
MGRLLLVGRLAVRNVRRRPAEAALLVLAIMAATAVLTLGLVLHGVTENPYQRTREATAGADVVASVGPLEVAPGRALPVDRAELDALTNVPGVVDHSGPYPATTTKLEANGVRSAVWAVGRDTVEVSVDQPKLTEGSWVRDGGVVIEAAFADALDVGVGDEVTLNGRSFKVVGVAVTAVAPYTHLCFGHPVCSFFYGSPPDWVRQGPPAERPDGRTMTADYAPPPDDAGLVWLTRTDASGLAPAAALSYVMNLRLADPADAPGFVAEHSPTSWDALFLASWQDIRDTYGEFVRGAQQALVTFSSLLTLLAMASVAVLVGGRMADQTRRVGLLKAVGGTPGLVAVVLLAEYVALAVLAAAAGLTVGWLAAPLLSDPGAGLLGSAGAPSLTLSTVGVVTGVALGVAMAASFVSAVRAARSSTVQALTDSARRPRRTRWLIALSTRLPAPLLLGVRVIARRPRRVLLGVASIAVTVSGIVVVLAGRAAMASDWEGPSSLDPEAGRANQVLLVLTVVLVGMAAVNAIVITWAAALDAKHASALARALGATPGQVSAGLSAAQVLPALVGAVLGIAGGLALWAAVSNDEANPTYWQLLTVVAGTVLAVAALTTIPAHIGARRPTAEILQAEVP